MVNVIPNKTFDPEIINHVYINKASVDEQVKVLVNRKPKWSEDTFKEWLLKAVSVIDLTTLAGDDTNSNVTRLCVKAANPLQADLVKKLGLTEKKITTAAVCVYPNRVQDAHAVIKRMGLLNDIQIASVATGFPSGLYPLHSRLQEVKQAINDGANEIDVVLDRSLVLTGKWEDVYNEVAAMKKECGNKAHLKVILGVGELGSYENVYKASMVSMFAGADFIKTSTGKEAVNATLPVGLIMCRAIRNFYQMTGRRVGLKPAGGIKTPEDAVHWLILVNNELGPDWLSPSLFRIGASSLLDVLEKRLSAEN